MIDHSKKIEEIVSGFFNAFDNRGSRIPDFDVFKKLFVEGSAIGIRTDEGVEMWSLIDFWTPRKKLLTGGGLTEFHEWETESDTWVSNGLAIRRSNYQKEGVLDAVPYGGLGTKCFQLALTPDGWRSTSVLWADQQ